MSEESSAAPAVTEQTSAAPAENVQVNELDLQGTLQGPEGEAPGEPEAATTGEAETGEKPKSGNKVPYKERVEQLVQARNAAQEENRHLTARIAELEARSKAATPASLDPLEYQTDAEYQEALQSATAKRVAEAVRHEILTDQQQAAQTKAAQARETVWSERVSSFREAAPDFEQVALNDAVRITPDCAALIKESESGPEIAYWLGKNPAESVRIANLPPLQAALEIGRIEARVSVKTAPRFTQAPPPVKTVNSGLGSGAKTQSQMSYKEYEASRIAALKGR